MFIEGAVSDTLSEMQVDMATDFGDVLKTRRAGTVARRAITRAIDGLPPGKPLCLDFAGVSAITVPFAEESIGQLLGSHLAGYYEDHPLLLINANEDVRETIAAALRPRRLAALSISNGGGAELLGGDELLHTTLQAAYEFRRPFAASEFADRLDLSPQAANNRLKALLRSGALTRVRTVPEGGGKEFLYALPLAKRASRRTSGGPKNGRPGQRKPPVRT